jgi:hypothetical protein
MPAPAEAGVETGFPSENATRRLRIKLPTRFLLLPIGGVKDMPHPGVTASRKSERILEERHDLAFGASARDLLC